MRLSRLSFAAVLIAASLANTIYCSAEVSPRAILIVDESDSNSPFVHRFREQVHSTLDAESAKNYIIYRESLDFGHFNGADYETTVRTFVKNKYEAKPINIIVAIGSEALRFVSSLRATLWPSASIVFVTFDNAPPTIPSNATGVIASRRFQDLVKAAQYVVPKVAQIVLVGEQLDRQPLRQHYKNEMRELSKVPNIIDLTGLPLQEIMKRIADLPSDAAIAYTPIYTDETGINHNPGEILQVLAERANRPIVVDSETLLGKGATGGIVVSAGDL